MIFFELQLDCLGLDSAVMNRLACLLCGSILNLGQGMWQVTHPSFVDFLKVLGFLPPSKTTVCKDTVTSHSA